ncbi:MAG: ECF-type sigma factor [Planctomycetota bacterium]
MLLRNDHIETDCVTSENEIDRRIQAAGVGDRAALDSVADDLYSQLHAIASTHMRSERGECLLQTTAIVHEAYLRLSDQQRSRWRSRNDFFAAASAIMRRLLIDHARSESAAKRGGKKTRTGLNETQLAIEDRRYSAIEVSDALQRLAEFAPDQARGIEMMVFGGMTGEEIAAQLNVSASTVDRKLRAAKAWLRRELR